MDTGLIIAIAVAALVLIALLVMLPRMRGAAKQKQAEREIATRRDHAVDTHRREAEERQVEADRLEHEARARRAEAEAHGERASLHQRGLADEQLVGDNESDLARRAGVEPAGERRVEGTRDVEGGRAHEPVVPESDERTR